MERNPFRVPLTRETPRSSTPSPNGWSDLGLAGSLNREKREVYSIPSLAQAKKAQEGASQQEKLKHLPELSCWLAVHFPEAVKRRKFRSLSYPLPQKASRIEPTVPVSRTLRGEGHDEVLEKALEIVSRGLE